MKWSRSLIANLALGLIVIGGLGWQYYYKSDISQSESMSQIPEIPKRPMENIEPDIVVEGSVYRIKKWRVESVVAPEPTVTITSIEVEVTRPSSMVELRTNESREVVTRDETPGPVNTATLRSIADIYTNFPFLKEPTLTPEAALLHAQLLTKLSGTTYLVIATNPTEAEVAVWHLNYQRMNAQSLKRFQEGPNADRPLPPVATGNINIDWDPPNYKQVTAPRQENGMLIYYVTFADIDYPLPIRASYGVNGSLNLQHQW